MSDLFLTTTTVVGLSGAAETTRWLASGAPGAAARLCNKNTVAAPAAAVKITDSATAGTDGNPVAWYSLPVQAVTIAGQIVASLWGRESANTANAAPSIGVYRCSALGAELATIVDPSVSQTGAELATTAGGATKTCTVTAANVVDTAIAAGELIKIALFIDNAADQGGSGSMGSGANCQLYVNGPVGAQGQSRVTFTETLLGLSQIVTDPVGPAVAGRMTNPGREAPTIFS